MSTPPAPLTDEERELARNRRTLYLMLGGAASLLLPLLGVAYLKYLDLAQPRHNGTIIAFQRRGADGMLIPKLTPAAAPAPPTAGAPLAQVPQLAPRDSSPAPIQGAATGEPAGGSLAFIRGGGDYYHDKAQQAPAAAAPQPAAPPPPAPAPAQRPQPAPAPKAVARTRSKPEPRPFTMPHLHTINTSNYGSFADRQAAGAAGAQNLTPQQMAALAAQARQQQGGGFGSSGGMPALGGFGRQQQQQPAQAPAQPAAGGTPDMAAILKNLPPGTDVSALLKNLPQNQQPKQSQGGQ